MVGGSVILATCGLVIAYVCGWRNGQSLAVAERAASSTTMNAAATPQMKPSQGISMVMNDDAFAIKERKKQQLLEKARKRYLELHPHYAPPLKSKIQ